MIGKYTTTTVIVNPGMQTNRDLRQTVIDVLRQQEGLKRKLHELLDQLGTHGRPTLG